MQRGAGGAGTRTMLVEGADMMALAKKMRMARETQSPRAKEVERGKGASAHVALWGATRRLGRVKIVSSLAVT